MLPRGARAQTAPLTRPIPSSGEALPLIGLGTWITFNVGADRALREQRAEVLQTFFHFESEKAVQVMLGVVPVTSYRMPMYRSSSDAPTGGMGIANWNPATSKSAS